MFAVPDFIAGGLIREWGEKCFDRVEHHAFGAHGINGQTGSMCAWSGRILGFMARSSLRQPRPRTRHCNRARKEWRGCSNGRPARVTVTVTVARVTH